MKNILVFFCRHQYLVNFITLLLITAGGVSLFNSQRTLFQLLETDLITISTDYPDASASDVERNITIPIENSITNIQGIKHISSESREGLSRISVILDENTGNKEKLIARIKDQITQNVNLPSGVRGTSKIQVLTSNDEPLLSLYIYGDIDYSSLWEEATRIKPQVLSIPGISKVTDNGYKTQQININIDPNTLKQYHLSLDTIKESIKNRNIQKTGSGIVSFVNEKNVVTLGQFENIDDLKKLILRSHYRGPRLHLSNVSEIEIGFSKTRTLSRFMGNTAISYDLYLEPGYDEITVSKRVKEILKDPPTDTYIKYAVVNDRAKYINKRYEQITQNAMQGALLVIVVIFILLNIKIAFWITISIISVLGATLTLIILLGYSIDLIALLAVILILGLIVDDAIIISENIFKHHENGLTKNAAITKGVIEMLPAVTTASLTTITAFLPMLFFPDILGKMIAILPLVITIALILSILDSVSLLPAHIITSINIVPNANKYSHHKRKVMVLIKRYTARVINYILRVRYLMVMLLMIGFVIAINYSIKELSFTLFTKEPVERFQIRLELSIGSSIQAIKQKVETIEKIVTELKDDELNLYYSVIGPENKATIFVNLTPHTARDRGYEEIKNQLKSQIDKLKDVKATRFVSTGTNPDFGQDLEIKILGNNVLLANQVADELVQYLNTYDAVSYVNKKSVEAKPELKIRLNHERMADMKLTARSIADTVSLAFDGEKVSSMEHNGNTIDIFAILNHFARQDENTLKHLNIKNSEGRLIALHNVADFVTQPGTAVINRESGKRVITVGADVDFNQISASSIIKQINEKFDLRYKYPGIEIRFAGETEESNKWQNRLLLAFVISVMSIYGLLVVQTESFSIPLIIIFSVPFGLVGVVVGFVVHAEPLSLLAGLGIIGMAGVVVNDALVLNSTIRNNRKTTNYFNWIDLISHSTAERVRAVFITSLTTIVGLLPLIYGSTDPMTKPLALSLVWGLLFSTILTLIIIPCLIMIRQDLIKEPIKYN